MTRRTTRARNGEDSRQRIIDATLAIAAERGYDGTSISQIRKATGLPASSIYWHFRDKDELLADALGHGFSSWMSVMPPWPAEPGPDDIEGAVHARLAWASRAMAETPAFWRLGMLLAITRRDPEPEARRRYLELRRGGQAELAQWWSGMLPEPLREDPEVARRLGRVHLAMIDGIFIGVLAGQGWDAERCTRLVAEGFIATLRRVHEEAR